MNVLDLAMTKEGSSVRTGVYKKPGHNTQYLHALSHHKQHCKTGIYKGELARGLMLANNASDFALHMSQVACGLEGVVVRRAARLTRSGGKHF